MADTSVDPHVQHLLDQVDTPNGENDLADAVVRVMTRWLRVVRDAILNGVTPPAPDAPDLDDTTVTAAPDDVPREPDLDQWPNPALWQQWLDTAVMPTATAVFDAAFRHHAGGADLSSERYRLEWITAVRDRLSRNLWPDGVYEEVRYELAEALANGESIDQMRDRVGTVLRIDAPSREVRARINEYKRHRQRVPAELWDIERDSQGVWHSDARRIARTEAIGAYNGGSFNAGRALQETTGIPRFKVWIATSDSRTRDAHRNADKQAVPLDESFDVGGEPLDYPGDPNGTPGNTIQCRCTTLTVKADEAERYNQRRADELPYRTDYRGRPVEPLAAAAETVADRVTEDTMPKPNSSGTAWADRVVATIPAEPPADWFTNPQLTGATKIRVTDQGRVYGHIAAWGTEHASLPGVTPPRDPYGGQYPRFHRHPLRTADGSRINTGPLATGGHSDIAADLGAVIQHYDDPTFVVADVRAGEDPHGIWVSGSLRSDATPFQVMLLDRYSISGDWRDGELVAACSVSVPGFHLDNDDQVVALSAAAGPNSTARLGDGKPRQRVDNTGTVTALVAAGVVTPHHSEQAELERREEARVWAQRRADRVVARAVADVQAAAKRIHHPAVAAAAARIRNTNRKDDQ